MVIKPADPKVRSLPKTNKSVQAKILAYPQAVAFLEAVDFNFSAADVIELGTYNVLVLNEAMDQISAHVVSLGGQVTTGADFDGTKAVRGNTTGEKRHAPPGLSNADADKYDPTKVQAIIDQIKLERQS